MRHRRAFRLLASDGDPGPVAWTLAVISLVLPVIGAILVVVGGAGVVRGTAQGWGLLGLGILLIAFDVLIDLTWANPLVSVSDQPSLNQRGAQLVGRIVVVVEPIVDGRGKVKVGDGVWAAEGPDIPAGSEARVVAANATLLQIEPLERGNIPTT